MKGLIIGIIISLFSFKTNTSCLKADIIILADISGSVEGYENYIKESLLSFVDKFELSKDGIQISLVLFNGSANIMYHLGDNKSELIYQINRIRLNMAYGGTYINNAFKSADLQFKLSSRDYSNKIIILISDGATNEEDESLYLSQYLQDKYNATIYGILINTPDKREEIMKNISTYYLQTDYEFLSYQLKQLDICL